MPGEQGPNPEAMEQMLSQIRGVSAIRVVCSASGMIDEIHVVGAPNRNPKQIVRDIETMLLVRHGIRIDHRKVSLVQIPERAIIAPQARVGLLDIHESIEDGRSIVTVTLALNELRVQGVGRARTEEPAETTDLVGYATVHALDQLITPFGHLRLERIQAQPFGHIQVFLSHLSLITEQSIETLLGISIAGDDSQTSAARSVLDAINRRLTKLLSGA